MMGFYKLLVLVLIFWSWLSIKGPLINYSNASPSKYIRNTEENKKKISGEMKYSFSFINLATRATQSLRRFLKMLRKWYMTHPPEVKLGKCFANYYNIKIPGLRRSLQYDASDERKNLRKALVENNRKDAEKTKKKLKKIEKKSLAKSNVSIARNYFKLILKNFWYFSNIFSKNQLLVCTWNYFLKKFWSWVDSAPN